ncbi:hypothetical protein LEP1GSC042_1315, partial [Leptospira kirschneri serovar Bim str. PUO 1247]
MHFYPSDSKIFFQLVGKVMALYESRWKLSTTLSMNRVVGSSYWYFMKIESDS